MQKAFESNTNMKFISESIIDATVNEVEGQVDQIAMFQHLEESQANILAYLLSDNFKMFSDEERDYVLFLTLVVCKSCEKIYPELSVVTEEQIATAEEQNWAVLEDVKTKNLRERWTLFFEGYSQEDLLAFVEDALEADEESQITKEGREYIFVSLKSIIDGIIAAMS